MNVDKETMELFFLESGDLLQELISLGQDLKTVRTPNREDSARLSDFAQKLNRLIGGTAAVGYEQFSPLSRKTSVLAEGCAEIKEGTIRLLIASLNNVVSMLADTFCDLGTVETVRDEIQHIEAKVDICLSAIGIDDLDTRSQGEVDSILAEYDL